MIARQRLCLAATAAALCLAGCVAQDGFPSLAMRPAEREVSFEPPVHPRAEVPSDAALRARVRELLGLADEGDRAFRTALGTAEAAVGAAGAAESESWIEAQEALSSLESTRAPTTRALSDLDRLAVDRADMPTSDEDYAALQAAVASVEEIAETQQRRVDRLRQRLAAR